MLAINLEDKMERVQTFIFCTHFNNLKWIFWTFSFSIDENGATNREALVHN